jgi:hemoglobin
VSEIPPSDRAAGGPALLPETSRSAPAAPLTLRTSKAGEAASGNFYEQVGGHETFQRLVDGFYRGVASDPVLRPMYPEQDLGPAADRLRMFLEQYWGGPTTYGEQRGHPRLRMRHVPFKVNPDARDRWLAHMRASLDELALPPLQDATLWAYLERAAHAMVNTFEE